MSCSRRETLLQGLGAFAGARLGAALAGLATVGVSGSAARGPGSVPYGAAVNHWVLPKDAAYREALSKYCSVVVAEGAMKLAHIRETRDRYDFEAADELVAFAEARSFAIRGHTLVWYEALPPWAEQISSAAEAERELTHGIERIVGRYAGRIASWDVVNEPIEDPPKSGLRRSLWHRYLGPDYIALALKTARAADPKAELVLNEFGIETADAGARAKRESFRRLVLDLRARGLPLDAIGLQGHLAGDGPIDRDGLQRFLREMTDLGLRVLVTELDVNDKMLPGPPDLTDAIVAARVYEFLDTVFSVTRPAAVLTWGITDRYTWMPIWHARPDKQRNRCLPLDEHMQPKPFMSVIRHFCGLEA